METQNQEIVAMPRIGDKAPEFKAVTTQGVINFPDDYKGSWEFFSAILLILLRFVPQSL